MTPEYPVVSTTALLVPAINSPNFNLQNPTASPSPSWAILQNGLAYFFGLVLSGGTITGPDYIINTAGIFIYSGTPANGNLIGSWAGSSGTDGFGNTYPQGFNITKGSISGTTFTGSDFTINTAGAFFYSGTPAANNLILSISVNVGATDAFGNNYLPGTVTYTSVSGGFAASQAEGVALAFYTATTMLGAFPWTQQGILEYEAGIGILLQSNVVPLNLVSVNSFLIASGGGLSISGLLPPVATTTAYLFVDSNGNASLQSIGGIRGQIPIVRVDTATTTLTNPLTVQAVSTAWPIPAGDVGITLGTFYEIEFPYSATMEGNNLSVGLVINGAAAFAASSAIAGAIVGAGVLVQGTIRLKLQVVSATTADVFVDGTIAQRGAAVSFTTSGSIVGTPALGVAFVAANNNTIEAAVEFAATNGAQSFTAFGSKFTRSGP